MTEALGTVALFTAVLIVWRKIRQALARREYAYVKDAWGEFRKRLCKQTVDGTWMYEIGSSESLKKLEGTDFRPITSGTQYYYYELEELKEREKTMRANHRRYLDV